MPQRKLCSHAFPTDVFNELRHALKIDGPLQVLPDDHHYYDDDDGDSDDYDDDDDDDDDDEDEDLPADSHQVGICHND